MRKLYAIIICILFVSGSFGQQQKINIVVDESAEMITVMQLLFEYPLVGKADIKYKLDVLTYFDKYKEDSSVLYFLDIAQKFFNFSRPFNYVWHFSFPDFKQTGEFTEYENDYLEFAKYKDSLKLFLVALKQFYNTTNFHQFFLSQKPFYDSIIYKVKQATDKINLSSILENHYGEKQHAYTLVLSPLSIESGMSISIKTKKGNDLYSIIGPNIDSKVTPVFDERWLMQYLVIHEFSHAFCNPLIDKHYQLLEKDSCLYTPVKKAMNQQACGDWRSTLNETLTRANEVVLIENIFGKDDADKIYNEYMGQKWVYLKGLIPVIKKYQANRAKYKKLDDIMPDIISYFDAEAKNCKH